MITDDPALLAAGGALRHAVFVVDQGVAPEIEVDGADGRAQHSIVLDGAGAVVGTGRLLEDIDEHGAHARLGRIAVRADQRGTGVGAAVMTDLERAAAAAGLPRMVLHAQQPVVGFYERLGWTVFGEPDVEAGLAHRWMTRTLLPGLRPVTDQDARALQDLVGGCYAEYPNCPMDLNGLDAWMVAPATAYAAKGGHLWVLPDPHGVPGALAASGGWQPGADPRTRELKTLYVGRAGRGGGRASALVGLVERAARSAGLRSVELWTDTRFTDAHRLYAGLGYQKLAETRELHDLAQSVEYHYRKDL